MPLPPPPKKETTSSNTALDPRGILQVLRVRFNGVDYLFFGPVFSPEEGEIQEIECLGLTTQASLIKAMTSPPEGVQGIQGVQ
jgi:thiamine monophosphate synthase